MASMEIPRQLRVVPSSRYWGPGTHTTNLEGPNPPALQNVWTSPPDWDAGSFPLTLDEGVLHRRWKVNMKKIPLTACNLKLHCLIMIPEICTYPSRNWTFTKPPSHLKSWIALDFEVNQSHYMFSVYFSFLLITYCMSSSSKVSWPWNDVFSLTTLWKRRLCKRLQDHESSCSAYRKITYPIPLHGNKQLRATQSTTSQISIKYVLLAMATTLENFSKLSKQKIVFTGEKNKTWICETQCGLNSSQVVCPVETSPCACSEKIRVLEHCNLMVQPTEQQALKSRT